MSKYKVGDKVVYEVKEIIRDGVYLLSGWKESEPLNNYTEPLEAKIRRQAAEITRLLAENKRLKAENGNSLWNIEQARAEGQNEAWELVRKIVKMKLFDYKEIFNSQTLRTAINMTYSEAAAKVAEWEKVKEEVKVGDILATNGGGNAVVTKVFNDGEVQVLFESGKSDVWAHTRNLKKTGRHIDIDSFLKQIGGENDEK